LGEGLSEGSAPLPLVEERLDRRGAKVSEAESTAELSEEGAARGVMARHKRVSERSVH
jgi:hypothetical protein